ncbi:MAG: hypothetical protein AB8H80_20810 [Planctomycetota bacterium]
MTHQLIETHLYRVTAPIVFEKMLVVGNLLRLERLDRQGGESSFAEANLFVGFVDEERLDVAIGARDEELLAALWRQYEASESPLSSFECVTERRGLSERTAVVRLGKTDWRPESGHYVWLRAVPSEERPVFARLVLEFDWQLRGFYEPLAEEMMQTLTWRAERLRDADVSEQGKQAWSIFDDMPVSRRDEIVARYRQILGKAPAPSAAPGAFPKPVAPTLLDLRAADLASLSLEQCEKHWGKGLDGTRVLLLQTSWLPDPIECTFECGQPDGYSLGDGTVGVLRALAALGDEHRKRAATLLWEHCRMCFDVTGYGAGEQSNEDFFGIRGPDDAWREAGRATIYLSENMRGGAHDLFQLDFYPPWEGEHGCSLVVRDGRLVGQSDPGGWLGDFELE